MIESLHFGILFLIGLSLLGGTLGAWLFQRLRIPQVVGYIAAGLIVGESGLRFITIDTIQDLRPFSVFALGVIGFLVGGELKLDAFRKYGRQFAAILLGEGLFAFALVGVGTGLVIWHLTGNDTVALAAGIVLGAIASATDPASTIDVLWEYRCRGVLTTSITAIVALDDALAMTLYAVGTGTAAILIGDGGSIGGEIAKVGGELGGALLLGGIGAVALNQLLRWLKADERTLALALGALLLMIGAATAFHLDVILAAMTCGFVLTNMAPKRSETMFRVLRGFSNPIYVLFFVLVGARLAPRHFPLWLVTIVLVYVLGRSFGKISGAWLGAKATRSPDIVRRYLGLGLFAQGGVAVGLSIVASQRLQGIIVAEGMTLGDAVISAVTATTLIVQVLGPPFVKYAVQKAGEAGRNRTEEDILAGKTVDDWMTSGAPSIREADPLDAVVGRFSQDDTRTLLVLDTDGHLLGVLPVQALRDVLQEPSAWGWMVVSDVMEPVGETLLAEDELREAVKRLRQAGLEECVVLSHPEDRRPIGMLDLRQVRERVTRELAQQSEASVADHEAETGGDPRPEKTEPTLAERMDLLKPVADVVRRDGDLGMLIQSFRQHPETSRIWVQDNKGQYAGCVSRQGLLRAMHPYEAASAQGPVDDPMLIAPIPMQAESLEDVLEGANECLLMNDTPDTAMIKMFQLGTDVLPVVGDDKRLLGEVRAVDLLESGNMHVMGKWEDVPERSHV